jgi:hypothetical protein
MKFLESLVSNGYFCLLLNLRNGRTRRGRFVPSQWLKNSLTLPIDVGM